jgi:hypothetical protein
MLEKRSARSARSAGSDPRSFLTEAKASGVLDGNPAQSAGWETGSANANRLFTEADVSGMAGEDKGIQDQEGVKDKTNI